MRPYDLQDPRIHVSETSCSSVTLQMVPLCVRASHPPAKEDGTISQLDFLPSSSHSSLAPSSMGWPAFSLPDGPERRGVHMHVLPHGHGERESGAEGSKRKGRCRLPGEVWLSLVHCLITTVIHNINTATHMFCFSREQRFRSAGSQRNVVCRVLFKSLNSLCLRPGSVGCALVAGTRKSQWLRTGERVSPPATGVSGVSAHYSHHGWQSRQSLDMPVRKIRAPEGLIKQLNALQTSWGRTWSHTRMAESACSLPVSA